MRFTSITFHFLLLLSTEVTHLQAQDRDSAEGDYEALMELYHDLGGNNWHNNSGWGSGSVVTNDWYGVEVDANNRVITLDLAGGSMRGNGKKGGNNLVGDRLTPKLGNLKKVEYINLKQNKIIGATLPAEWKNMSSLKKLYVSGSTSLVDPDWTFGMTSIKDNRVDEATNIIEGELPPGWGDMPSIQVIDISFTSSRKDANGNFTGGITGTLPPEWGKMSTLRSLILDHNVELGGTYPPEWGNLTELNHLHIWGTQHQNNQITGTLPAEWGGANGYPGMRKLTQFKLAGTLDGNIPDSWQNMKMLWQINLEKTGLDTDFPDWLGNGDFHNRVVKHNPDPDALPVEAYHSGLSMLSMDYNNFTGNLPDLSNMTWLSTFRIYGSNVGGSFPADASGLTRLIQFEIGGNNVSGQLPDLSSWRRLRYVNVPGNSLSGPLPDLKTDNGSFRNSQWQGNSFSGSIPASWNFPGSNNIFRLWLHNNNLSGPIPERLADPGHSYSSGFRVDGNRYVFADLVPFIKLGPNNFQYAPQQAFGSAKTYYLSEGESINLDDFSGVVTHSGNRYQWKKDGANISGATSRTLSFSSFSAGDEGTYTLVVTNPGAPELTLTSKKITLVIGDGNDGGDGGDGGSDGSDGSQEPSAPAQVQ